MSDNPSAIALSIEETASSLRRMATSGGRQGPRTAVGDSASDPVRAVRPSRPVERVAFGGALY